MIADGLILLGAALLVLGAAFTFVAALGILRFPDLYTRMHAASKAGAVGGGLILLAVGLVSLDWAVMLRAVIGVLFLLLTTPLAAHLLARASFLSGYEAAPNTAPDEMKSHSKRLQKR